MLCLNSGLVTFFRRRLVSGVFVIAKIANINSRDNK